MIGFHPVSGNRQFGYKTLSNGHMEIFTRGTDRFYFPPSWEPNSPNKLIAYLMEAVAFTSADALWESLQDGLKQFADANEGSATKNSPNIKRPKVGNDLKNILYNTDPITALPCGN